MSSTPVSDAIAASLSPWNDDQGAWETYSRALASMFEGVYAIVADFGSPDQPSSYQPGYSVLLDPVNCPAEFLPYCGLYWGVIVPSGTDEASARALIQAKGGFFGGSRQPSSPPRNSGYRARRP